MENEGPVVQISNMNISNTLLFLVEKSVRILCIGFSHFINKNNSVFAYVVSINVTS